MKLAVEFSNIRGIVRSNTDFPCLGYIIAYFVQTVIFQKPSVFCPSAETCYCNVFGLCDLVGCTVDDCGRYVMPMYTDIPEGWKQLPEYDVEG